MFCCKHSDCIIRQASQCLDGCKPFYPQHFGGFLANPRNHFDVVVKKDFSFSAAADNPEVVAFQGLNSLNFIISPLNVVFYSKNYFSRVARGLASFALYFVSAATFCCSTSQSKTDFFFVLDKQVLVRIESLDIQTEYCVLVSLP
jgi:hypothetical protein